MANQRRSRRRDRYWLAPVFHRQPGSGVFFLDDLGGRWFRRRSLCFVDHAVAGSSGDATPSLRRVERRHGQLYHGWVGASGYSTGHFGRTERRSKPSRQLRVGPCGRDLLPARSVSNRQRRCRRRSSDLSMMRHAVRSPELVAATLTLVSSAVILFFVGFVVDLKISSLGFLPRHSPPTYGSKMAQSVSVAPPSSKNFSNQR